MMCKTIEDIIQAVVEDIDSKAIVPAEFEGQLRKLCDNYLARYEVETYEDLSEEQQANLCKTIQRRKLAVLSENPYLTMVRHASSQHLGKQLVTVALAPSIGALVTLGALVLASNR